MQLSVSRAPQGARARRGCSVQRRAVRCSAQQAGAASDAPLLRVGFSLRARVGFGDTVKLTGSHAALGEWDVARAVPLAWAQDGDGADVWTAVVELPEHFVVRYKFLVLRADGALQWQPGDDSTTVASAEVTGLGSAEAALDMFRVNAKLPFGEHFLLVGAAESLGAWQPGSGVALRWTHCDVWQGSASLPREAGECEYKLVKAGGEQEGPAWLGSLNERLPQLQDTHTAAQGGRCVSRHLHRSVAEGWWQPWYWAPELGNCDCLVFLPDVPPGSASDQGGDSRRASGARDAAALAQVRAQSNDGLALLTGVARAAGADSTGGARAVLAAADASAGQGSSAISLSSGGGDAQANFQAAARTAAGAAAGVASLAGAAATLSGSDAALIALQPAAEVAALGMLVAFGARNLLFAEDRERFISAAGSRAKLLKLIRDNMSAVGVGGNAEVAAAVSKSAAEAGFLFDPLELLNEEDEDEGAATRAQPQPPGLQARDEAESEK